MKVYIRIEYLRFSLKIGFNLNNEIIKVKAETPNPQQTILINDEFGFKTASKLILDYDLNPSYKNQFIKKAREAR